MKYSRHAKILEIIEKNAVETQEELVDRLRECGMDVTQATVSRDIKDLRLTKVAASDGRYRYASITAADHGISNKHLTILSEAFISADYANNIVVIKTLSGMAQAAGAAIDSMKWPETVGTIAGDDTVMIVVRAEKMAEEMVNRFNRLVIRQGDGKEI